MGARGVARAGTPRNHCRVQIPMLDVDADELRKKAETP